MTKNKYIKGFYLFFILLTIGACSDDFLDVNTNPNTPSQSTPSLTLPVAQENFASLNGTSMVSLGNFMAYNWAVPSNWSALASQIRYTVTPSFFATVFETSYGTIFRDLTYVENFEDPAGVADYTNYKAISKILKGFQYQYLVDLYGDVPYSEANLRADNPTPKYDDAETVYKANIEELNAAIALIQNAELDALNPGGQDTMFGGDMDDWVSFANTIKLRMLVRMSGAGQDSYINGEIAKITANAGGFVTSSVFSNPGYSDNSGKQSPFWGYAGFSAGGGAQTNRHDYTVATDYTINYLNTTNDPRMTRLYHVADNGGYKGAEQSTILPGTGFTSNDLSKIGDALLVSPSQDQPILLSAESYFLQAEAILKGYLPGGDAAAKTMYQNGITASFQYLGVASASDAATTYYSQDGVQQVNWDSTPNKLEAIMRQKWIALNGTSSIELWIEHTRTGFPADLPVPAEASSGSRPVRLLYPDSELARNADNVPSQANSEAFNNPPFWK